MTRKLLLTLLWTCLFTAAKSQGYCRYFTLKIKSYEREGKTVNSAMPEIGGQSRDSLAVFIMRHHYRYEYLLLNAIDSVWRYNKLLPDSNRARTIFCADLSNSSRFDSAFKILTQLKRKQKPDFTFFTVDEMMLVASRFFMCDKVREQDTSVSAHICIGLNGQKALTGNKDYTALAAFCFEGIFEHLQREENSVVENHFQLYRAAASSAAKVSFKGFDPYLEEVKTACYDRMANDTVLKQVLLRHYRNNKGAMNLVIR